MTDAVTEQTLMRLKEHGGQASAAVFVAAEGLGFEVICCNMLVAVVAVAAAAAAAAGGVVVVVIVIVVLAVLAGVGVVVIVVVVVVIVVAAATIRVKSFGVLVPSIAWILEACVFNKDVNVNVIVIFLGSQISAAQTGTAVAVLLVLCRKV